MLRDRAWRFNFQNPEQNPFSFLNKHRLNIAFFFARFLGHGGDWLTAELCASLRSAGPVHKQCNRLSARSTMSEYKKEIEKLKKLIWILIIRMRRIIFSDRPEIAVCVEQNNMSACHSVRFFYLFFSPFGECCITFSAWNAGKLKSRRFPGWQKNAQSS